MYDDTQTLNAEQQNSRSSAADVNNCSETLHDLPDYLIHDKGEDLTTCACMIGMPKLNDPLSGFTGALHPSSFMFCNICNEKLRQGVQQVN